MAHGHDFRRAIDRIVDDLTRIAERAIAIEVERAIALAIDPIERTAQRSAAQARRAGVTSAAAERAAFAAERRAARAEERERRVAEREQEKSERDAERQRRKDEREQLRAELKAAREAVRTAQAADRARAKQEAAKTKLDVPGEREAREARHRALTEKQHEPPPLVVFKRSRDGQVTVLQPKPVEGENQAASAPVAAAVAGSAPSPIV